MAHFSEGNRSNYSNAFSYEINNMIFMKLEYIYSVYKYIV